jgi:alanine racemase
MELITDNPEITLLNDSYNADAASVRHAFSLLAAQESQPRKVVIISDLEHQGERAPTLQRELAELALERFGAGNVMLIGPLFSRLMAETPLPGAAAYPDLDAFLKAFRYEDFTQSVILLKGARKFRLETLIPYFSQQAATTYLKINLNALKQNLEVFRSRVPNQTRLMAMLKAAAYGSGGWQLAQELEREGVDYIGVAYTVEGIELRRRGIRAPILVLNPDFATLAQLWRFELQPAVWSFPLLQQLAAIAAERQTALPIHLEFDTGMGRLGFEPGQVEPVLDALRSTAGAEHLPIASVFSHLAAADAPAQDPFTEQQLAQFEAVAERIQTQYPESLRHILNTGGALRWPGRAGDMVRIGLGLYGISPVPALQRELQEIASLHSSISQIHHYPAGTSISYGRTYVLEAPARIATIPVGYADGIPRALSNGKLEALVHGQRCPVVGVICMDMLMLDVTAVPQAQAGDEVVFFGRQAAPSDSETFQSITTLAEAANTIPYEILTGLSLRLRRLYVKE